MMRYIRPKFSKFLNSLFFFQRANKQLSVLLGYDIAIQALNYHLALIGLHGPDILFYYKPLKSNLVNRIGYGMHGRPGIEFFRHAVKVIENKDNKLPYLAWQVYSVITFIELLDTIL